MAISVPTLIITALITTIPALLTLLLKEYFEYKGKQKEREYETKKLFAQRKIEAAENAIRIWLSMRRLYKNLISIISVRLN